MERSKTVEEYIFHNKAQMEMLHILRDIILSTSLEETIKWGAPVYTWSGKNIVGLGAFKAYTGIWFFQGAFLSDPGKKLINAQEGKTKGLRQWRFSSLEEVDKKLIRSYVLEAIENQQKGKEIRPERKQLIIPEELKEIMETDMLLKESFEKLGLTKKREFAEYITEAKQASTRSRRLQKIIPMIREGVGLNDKYRANSNSL